MHKSGLIPKSLEILYIVPTEHSAPADKREFTWLASYTSLVEIRLAADIFFTECAPDSVEILCIVGAWYSATPGVLPLVANSIKYAMRLPNLLYFRVVETAGEYKNGRVSFRTLANTLVEKGLFTKGFWQACQPKLVL